MKKEKKKRERTLLTRNKKVKYTHGQLHYKVKKKKFKKGKKSTETQRRGVAERRKSPRTGTGVESRGADG